VIARDDDPSRTFGGAIRRYREDAALTQEALAERSRLSKRAISDLERGERQAPHRDTVALLADALGLDQDARRALEALIVRTRATSPRERGRRGGRDRRASSGVFHAGRGCGRSLAGAR